MKIISKYKDYYDYLVGIYGEDPKLILDRRDMFTNEYLRLGSPIIKLFVGDKLIEGIFQDGKFHYGKDLDQFHDDRDEAGHSRYEHWNKDRRLFIKGENIIFHQYCLHGRKNETYTVILNKHITDTDVNSVQKCPILVARMRDYEIIEYLKFPKLSDFGIQGFYTAKDAWIQLSYFLASQVIDKPVPIGDDKVRIQSHGFDLKTSFRPKMKSV